MPELGQRQEFGRNELAELRVWQVQGFENFLVFYRPVERGIEVLRVLHAARDIDGGFRRSGVVARHSQPQTWGSLAAGPRAAIMDLVI